MSGWEVGDKIATREVADGQWMVMRAEAARKLGVTEDSPGWRFTEVVAS